MGLSSSVASSTGCRTRRIPFCVVTVMVRCAVSKLMPHLFDRISFVSTGSRSFVESPETLLSSSGTSQGGSSEYSNPSPSTQSDSTLMTATSRVANSESENSIKSLLRINRVAIATQRSSDMVGRCGYGAFPSDSSASSVMWTRGIVTRTAATEVVALAAFSVSSNLGE